MVKTKRKSNSKKNSNNQDWIDFVRLYQDKTGLPWSTAMQQAGGFYREAQIDRILQEGYDEHQRFLQKQRYNRQVGGYHKNHRYDKGKQVGGGIFDTLLSPERIQQAVNYGIQLMGDTKFFGLDAKTVGNLVNLVLETGKSAGSLTEMLTVIQQNPYANLISQIPFTGGPTGVREAMTGILAQIDQEPNGADIYNALCAIYRTVLAKSSTLFIKIIGSLAPGSAESKANNQNRIVRAIQSLNYDALANEYNSLPNLVKQLVEDPNALQATITQVMGVLSQSSSSLGTIIQKYLYPFLNSTIEAVRKVLPITFATLILLERCGGLPAEEIEQLNKLILPVGIPTIPTGTPLTTSLAPLAPLATPLAAPLTTPLTTPLVAPLTAPSIAPLTVQNSGVLSAAQELAALEQIKAQQERIAKLEAALQNSSNLASKVATSEEQLRQAQQKQQEDLIKAQAEQLRQLQNLQQRQLVQVGAGFRRSRFPGVN